jgi:GTP-binding protein EngB required for normal cell division
VGVQQYIQLPRIAVLGTQSSGKSSVLESIVGLDFLARGDGVVTRRPLELRLVHIADGINVKPWAVFEEKKGEKFEDFDKVRQTIEDLTDSVCVGEKNIVDKPIILNVYSPTCPDLTLIDLPGITKVPVGKQPHNIEEITKNMAEKYVKDPMTIILCVIQANTDISTSDGLKMAREIDREGGRTIGVLTKLDLIDEGAHAKEAIMNETIPLKLGYVAVKNRSKQDLINRISMKDAVKKEKDFFSNHPVYRRLPPGLLGTDVLIQKLTKILFKMIREHLPAIIKAINEQVKRAEEELALLGQPLPVDDVGKLNLLWNMLSEYCETYKNVLKGKYDSKRLSFVKDEGGYKVKALFKDLLLEYTGEYKATSAYTDDKINYALTIHEGDSIPGFPSVDAFYYLLKPELEKLREPITECLINVFQYLEVLSAKILEKSFQRFPRIIDDVNDFVTKFLNEERDKAKYIVDSVVDMEISYLFTNDMDYLQNYTTFIPKNQDGKGQMDSKNIFIREIRNRIEAYFKLVVRNLRDAVPKAIGYFLVKSIQDNMQLRLYNQLYKSTEMVSVLNEPDGVARQREELVKAIKVMKDAQKVIRRDPDLLQVMQINVSDNDISKQSMQMESSTNSSSFVNNGGNVKPLENAKTNLFGKR